LVLNLAAKAALLIGISDACTRDNAAVAVNEIIRAVKIGAA
jgi:hypothetical protein